MNETEPKQPWLPPRWFIHLAWKVHRGLFRITGGRFGLRRAKGDTYGLMRVTTIGRKSGREHAVMLGYVDDGDDLVTMAMNGWGAPEPAWWLNLQAHPEVRVETRDADRTMRGRAADPSERERLWKRWAEIDKNLDGYAARRPTETAVVILEPVS